MIGAAHSVLGGRHAAAGGDFENGVADVIDQIAGGHRDFAVVGVGELAGGSMQIDSDLACGFRIEQLREPGAEHAGQHIARAAGRHAGAAGRIHEHFLIGRDDERPITLEDDVELVALREIGGDADAIGLQILDGAARPAAPFRPDAA